MISFDEKQLESNQIIVRARCDSNNKGELNSLNSVNNFYLFSYILFNDILMDKVSNRFKRRTSQIRRGVNSSIKNITCNR